MPVKDTFFQKKYTLNLKGELIELNSPKIMGILNITPDSFYDGSKYNSIRKIIEQIEKMINDGADFIDIGAVSTRPGAKLIPEDEEWKRLQPVLEIILKNYNTLSFSVDTYRSEIARRSVNEYGAAMINDISAGEMDTNMFKCIAELNVPYIIMHMQGNPENMQTNPSYVNVTKEVISYLAQKVEMLKKLGVKDIIIDPGFGFGKTLEHNYELLFYLDTFQFFELPLLAGFSRKSMLYKFFNTSPDEALNGTTVLNTIALLKGADILRVHDVKEAKEAIRIVMKMNEYKKGQN